MTSAFRIVVFEGRCFVYDPSRCGDLEGLGTDVVGEIPTSAIGYRNWLRRQRQKYAQLTAVLKEQVLRVSTQEIQDILRQEDAAGLKQQMVWKKPRWRRVQNCLHDLPTAFCDIFEIDTIKYLYIVDLDQELFTVNDCVFFQLWNIPRDRWVQAFKGRQNSFSFELCPEAFCTPEPPQYIMTLKEKDKLRAAYQQYKVDVQTASYASKLSDQTRPKEFVALIAFSELVQEYHTLFHRSMPRWASENFAFRESAFAIVSLASGKFYFDNLEHFSGRNNIDVQDERYNTGSMHGFLVDKPTDQHPGLMPMFGSGYHGQDEDPGSAPAQNIYWLEDVLVSLLPDSVFDQGMEVAVARTIMWATNQGCRSFSAVLCSVLRVVYLEVHVRDDITHVQRTDPVNLFDNKKPDSLLKTVTRTGNDNNTAPSTFAELERNHRGFRTLQNFFQSAAMRKLKVYGRGQLPVEVYANIIAHADESTSAACEKVSPIFHTICQERFHFDSELVLLKVRKAQRVLSDGEELLGELRPIEDFGLFIFEDNSTGFTLQSRWVSQWEMGTSTWCPVIGPSNRPSIITAARIRLDLD